MESIFKSAFRAISKDVHKTATSKGWHDGEINDAECVALMHSELSEALEGLRAGNPPDSLLPEFSSVEVELADVIIRIMDYAEEVKLDIAGALIAKAEFNKTRPYKHGGKKF